MKEYRKPMIEMLSFTQKERVAADCRFCYEGYENNSCTSQSECWVDNGGSECIPSDWASYGAG